MDLSILNPSQKEAVITTEGRIRVIAGAGSGKTRALAYRYAYIVNELGVDPANILCLTFTNKAAQEMRSRISGLVPPGYTNDFVCTIHGFCVRFLREEIHRAGYPRNFRILDEEDMKSLARQVLIENNADRSVKTVRELINKVSDFKNSQPYIGQYICSGNAPDDRTSLPLTVQMIYRQRDMLALDFDDLLAFTLYLMDMYPDMTATWQERMTYVMVDETQDCNASDWKLIDILSRLNGNLFVVGDPDQAIYEWRGAKPGMFISFRSDKDITLDENYRSTPGILNVANSIITNNRNRLEKTMFTRRTGGDSIIHFHAQDEKQEAAWVCSEIAGKVQENGQHYSDFAVLFRSAHLSRFIEQALIQSGIPYVMWGGVRFFERKEIKDCISYLRLVAGDDDLAFERIVNIPSRKVGKSTMEVIAALAAEGGCSMYQALKDNAGTGKLDRPALTEFISLIEICRAAKGHTRVSAMMEHILEKTGLKAEYRDDNDEQRLENITELLTSMKLYESGKEDGEMDLDSYLQDIALYTNADYRKDTDKVRLMTVHQSKGLEFPYVFIIGLSEGIFPNARSIRERKRPALEEERRLMYVAATRAEKCLYMTESEGFNIQAQQDKLPSRFIAEIKREYFVTEGKMDEALWSRLKNQVEHERFPDDPGCTSDGTVPDDAGIIKGTTVRHRVFGTGTVEEVQDNGTCKVRFSNGSLRFLRSSVLEPVAVVVIPDKSGNKVLS